MIESVSFLLPAFEVVSQFAVIPAAAVVRFGVAEFSLALLRNLSSARPVLFMSSFVAIFYVP